VRARRFAGRGRLRRLGQVGVQTVASLENRLAGASASLGLESSRRAASSASWSSAVRLEQTCKVLVSAAYSSSYVNFRRAALTDQQYMVGGFSASVICPISARLNEADHGGGRRVSPGCISIVFGLRPQKGRRVPVEVGPHGAQPSSICAPKNVQPIALEHRRPERPARS